MMLTKAAMRHDHVHTQFGRRACSCCAGPTMKLAKRRQRRRDRQEVRELRYG